MNLGKAITTQLHKQYCIKLLHSQLKSRTYAPKYCSSAINKGSDLSSDSDETETGKQTYFQDYKNIYESAGIFQSPGTLRNQQLSGEYQNVHKHQRYTKPVSPPANKDHLENVNTNKSIASDKYYDQYYKIFNNDKNSNENEELKSEEYYEKYHQLVQSAGINSQQSFYEQSKSGKRLTHTNETGQLNMVDVSQKPDTSRIALASAKVWLGEDAFQLVKENKMKKGDVLATAKIAGIMAAKNTSTLIPLCHPLIISNVNVNTSFIEDEKAIGIECEVHTNGKTGVEMEALTGVSVAALTIYDMCKAVTHNITINDVQLVHKSGGMSGNFYRFK